MNGNDGSRPSAHVFISYVREDADRVNRLQEILEAAGAKVWRDTEELWPGQDWKLVIKRAITSESLAFIACFSENSQLRAKSYQNEELTLAVEEMRLRTPGQAWLIPVRFADCEIPEFDLGAGRTLASIQRVDLFDDSWERGAARLVATVIRILGLGSVADNRALVTSASIASQLKSTLLASDKQIELEGLISTTTKDVCDVLVDETLFPINSTRLNDTLDGVRFLVGQADVYHSAVKPAMSVLAPGCRWGRQEHEIIWTRTLKAIVNADKRGSGKSVLIALERLPALIALYAAGIGAQSNNNFGSMRAVAIDATYRGPTGTVPLITAVYPGEIFTDNNTTANILARQADGSKVSDAEIDQLMRGGGQRRRTPVSDYLYQILRPAFSDLLDDEYSDIFDEFEGFLGVLATDVMLQAKTQNRYLHGAWPGRFIWRQGSAAPVERQLSANISSQGENWPPLKVGLFGGSAKRAELAAIQFVSDTTRFRQLTL